VTLPRQERRAAFEDIHVRGGKSISQRNAVDSALTRERIRAFAATKTNARLQITLLIPRNNTAAANGFAFGGARPLAHARDESKPEWSLVYLMLGPFSVKRL